MTNSSRKLGVQGPTVFPLALGCSAMSGSRDQPGDDAESVATLQEAIERGVALVDTADFYGSGHNELLIGRAIQGRRDRVVLSLKFGGLRGPDGAWIGVDTRPAALKNFLAYSLRRLGVDHVDIYRPARLDPQVPIEDTIGAIADLVQAGYVGQVGLSEVGADTLRRAHAVHPICDVQVEYSLMSRAPATTLFPVARELGVAITAYGVLSHGLLSGRAAPAAAGDQRAHLPRFKGENFAANQKLVEALREVANDKGATTSQLAIAWVLAQGEDILPVIGARKRAQLQEALGALELRLGADDLVRIERAVPADAVAGTRYAEAQMKLLDSENPSRPG